jgi:hypothetical protein
MGSKYVVWLTIIRVVPTENGDEMLIKPINEVIAYRHREATVFIKWTNTIHHPLIVSKDRGSGKGTFTILVSLANMLKHGMWLVGVAQADLMKY